jgi:hypothetical protein
LFVKGDNYCSKRKNSCVPEMGFVTVFCPPTTTGDGKFVFQTDKERFVVHCNITPGAYVGQVKRTFVAARIIVSCGGGSERLNTVPPPLPPILAVP